MSHRESHLLSPYRPPTSYPVSLNPEEASVWLNGYFALWHPAALAGRAKPPQASSSYDHDTPVEGHLYCVPTGPHLYQPDDWASRVKDSGAAMFSATPNDNETATNLKTALESLGTDPALLAILEEVVRLFTGLGFGYLLVESLFDAMDHEHLLDADGFWMDVQSAVTAATGPDALTAVRSAMTPAIEKLRSAREALNSNSLKLVDLAMPKRATLGSAWPASLASGLPLAVIASGELLEELAEKHPERFAELKSKFVPDLPSTVDICCGAYHERDDALLPNESQFWNFAKARESVRKLLGIETDVFARQTSAFHAALPSWLQHAGYKSAVLVSFDGALTPNRSAAILNWSAPDGKSLTAFGREPLAADDPLTFFNLVYHLHQAFTNDSIPTVAFKHTGSEAAPGYRELIAVSELGDVAGEWVGLNRHLADNPYGDYLGTTGADDYFTDSLDNRVTTLKRPDPVSGFAIHQRLRRHLDTAFALAALHRMLTPPGETEAALLKQLEVAETAIERRGVDVDGQADIAIPEAEFAKLLADRIQVRSAENQPGLMVFNPCNFPRRVALEIADFGNPIAVAEPVKAAEFHGRSAKLVVEVPSLGYAWVPRNTAPGTLPPKPRIKTAENATVRNEFFEADFDPVTGALRAFRDGRTRVNRLGMQLVFNPGSKTKARSVTVTNAGTALGEIVCEGDILDEQDQLLATFRQRLRAWVGRPAMEMRIEIEPKHSPSGYPWHAYYGARFACRDDRAAIFRGVQGANFASTYTRPVSPDYLEFRLGGERTFVFTGGLPFLQKHGTRMVDVVLIPEGEKCHSFDLLLALDRDYPMQTAAGWNAPAPVVATEKGPPHIGPTGWLAHVDLPSLLMTSLKPCEPGEGMTRAVAMRLTECSGFAGQAHLQFARDPNRAVGCDNDAMPWNEITLAEGMVPVDFSSNETFRVKAEWK